MADRTPLARPAEVAEYLGKSLQSLAALRSRGRGPSFSHVGRQVRYAWSDVDAYIAATKQESTEVQA